MGWCLFCADFFVTVALGGRWRRDNQELNSRTPKNERRMANSEEEIEKPLNTPHIFPGLPLVQALCSKVKITTSKSTESNSSVFTSCEGISQASPNSVVPCISSVADKSDSSAVPVTFTVFVRVNPLSSLSGSLGFPPWDLCQRLITRSNRYFSQEYTHVTTKGKSPIHCRMNTLAPRSFVFVFSVAFLDPYQEY